MASIFSKIVSGEIPCFKLYEDDHCLAFMDIRPVSPGHSLVISKNEYPTIEDLPDEVMASLGLAVKKVGKAVKATLNCPAYNLIVNNGSAAGQEVPHLHFHVIPRFDDDGLKLSWPSKRGDMEAIKSVAEKIAAQLNS